jgi:hypothetical protein
MRDPHDQIACTIAPRSSQRYPTAPKPTKASPRQKSDRLGYATDGLARPTMPNWPVPASRGNGSTKERQPSVTEALDFRSFVSGHTARAARSRPGPPKQRSLSFGDPLWARKSRTASASGAPRAVVRPSCKPLRWRGRETVRARRNEEPEVDPQDDLDRAELPSPGVQRTSTKPRTNASRSLQTESDVSRHQSRPDLR